MAISSATVTMNLADLLGVDFDIRRTKVWVSTNIPGNAVIDTVGNQIRLGTGNVTLNADGTASLSTWIPGTGANPASWQTYVNVDYRDSGSRERVTRTFGPFTITGNADLADLVAEQEIPPTYLSEITTALTGYVSIASGSAVAAATSASAAAASATYAHDISSIATPDALVAALVPTSTLSATTLALAASFTQNGWFDDFSNTTDWQTNWTTAFRAPGDFVVSGGKGRLRCTGAPTSQGADVYLKSRVIPFRSGFTVVAKTKRVPGSVGQFTEFEMGVDTLGPIWHFEWSESALIFWRQVRSGSVVNIVQETPVSIGDGDDLTFSVTCTRRTITFAVLNGTTGRVIFTGVFPLDFTIGAEFDAGAHLNFVTTGTTSTSLSTPVAQDIDSVRVTYLPVGDGGDATYSKLYAAGGNVLIGADGKARLVLSGIVTNVAGGGIAPGDVATNDLTFPVQLPGAPVVTLTPVGRFENGGQGDCRAWLKGPPTSSGFSARIQNVAPSPTTQVGRLVNASGGGIGTGATSTVTVTFPAAFSTVPEVQVTAKGGAEGSTNGACRVWLKSVTASQFVAIFQNDATSAQTFDLHWAAALASAAAAAQTVDLHWRAEYALS